MTVSIYILRLESGKYYVGKTDDVPKRYQEHLNGLLGFHESTRTLYSLKVPGQTKGGVSRAEVELLVRSFISLLARFS
jgi:predicted GIY-YIG superfamily endonuclease